MSLFTTPLINADALRALMSEGAAPVLLDCSFDLASPAGGEQAFAAGHLPGARYVHLDRDLSGPKSADGPCRGGRHPLPSREAFAQRVATWGVAPGIRVVVYDTQGATYAARAWWMLRWLGHDNVAVLDGGLAAWQAAGGALEAGTGSAVSPADTLAYPLADVTMPTIDAETLVDQAGTWFVLDARAAERFRGDVEPLDTRAGHIPGARNRFFRDNLAADGRFLPADDLRSLFSTWGVPAGRIVHQCGSGVTACHNLLAMEVAGLHGSRLYPGSWSEWSANPDRPVAIGA